MTYQCYDIHSNTDLDRWLASSSIVFIENKWFNHLVNFKESDKALSLIGVITNIVDHIYYPVEKICWLAEHKCITLHDPNKWDTISSIFWVTSIYLNLMRYVRVRRKYRRSRLIANLTFNCVHVDVIIGFFKATIDKKNYWYRFHGLLWD